jgi:hypothetical protein
MLNENGILYTFSTIAQALGGAFGFLSAFVLYRFQSLNRAMEKDAIPLRGMLDELDGTGAQERFELALAQSQFSVIVAWIDRKIEKPEGRRVYEGERKAAHIRMSLSVAQRRGILFVFWITLWVTGIVMAGSVGVIPRAHFWSVCEPDWAGHAMCIGVVAFATCLVLYLAVIWASVTNRLTLFKRIFGSHNLKQSIGSD